MPGRAVCPALGTGGRWTPWHAERPPGASDRANEAGYGSGCRAGSAQVPGWLVERLRLGVGHASTVRPDPSTLGAVGERGSHHESCLQLVPGCCVGRWLPGGEEQVAVKAEELPSLASDLVAIGQPGVGFLPGELATSAREVS